MPLNLSRLRPFSIIIFFITVLIPSLNFLNSAEDKASADWWSLQKVKRPEIPEVKNKKWARNPIDHFILSKLEEKGINPSPEADTRSITRRLHFDLTGLPPGPDSNSDINALLEKSSLW